MWKCKVCSSDIEDEKPLCYYCGSARDVDPESAERARRKAQERQIKCLRCGDPLRYAGMRKFHEGSRAWGFWLGDLGELFTHREEYDLYVCPRCGRIEMFVDGVGEELRAET